eukprot:5805094-Amphidinium_carterae.1
MYEPGDWGKDHRAVQLTLSLRIEAVRYTTIKSEPLKEQDATFEWMDGADSLLWEHSLAGGDLNSLWTLWNHAAEQYLGAQGKRGQLRLCVRTLETPEGNPKASNLAEREDCIMQLHHALAEGPVSAL